MEAPDVKEFQDEEERRDDEDETLRLTVKDFKEKASRVRLEYNEFHSLQRTT